MYRNSPVKIPKVPGKIYFNKKEGAVYVRYLLGREYDREKKYNIPIFKVIGVQLEHMPSLMLPNEYYDMYFDRNGNENRYGNEEERSMEMNTEVNTEMNEEERAFEEGYRICRTYKPFFLNLFSEIKSQAKRNLNGTVSNFQIRKLNRIMEPLLKILQEEDGGELLQLIEIPEGQTEITYADLMVIMIEFKCAFEEYMYRMM